MKGRKQTMNELTKYDFTENDIIELSDKEVAISKQADDLQTLCEQQKDIACANLESLRIAILKAMQDNNIFVAKI